MFSPSKSNFDIGPATTTKTDPVQVNAPCPSSLNNYSSIQNPNRQLLLLASPSEHTHIENNITESYKNRKNSLREVRNSGQRRHHQHNQLKANDNPPVLVPLNNNKSNSAATGGKEKNMNPTRRNGELHPSTGTATRCSGQVYGNNSGNINSGTSGISLSGVSPSINNRSSANSAAVIGPGNGASSSSDLLNSANKQPQRSSGPDEVAAVMDAVPHGVNGDVIVVTRPRPSHGGSRRDRRRRPSESEISSRTSHSTKSSFSTSSSSRYSRSGTPCRRGSSCSEVETSSSTSSSESESGEADLPYPGFPAISLKYLTQTTKPRNWCLRLITNPYPFSKHNNNVFYWIVNNREWKRGCHPLW